MVTQKISNHPIVKRRGRVPMKTIREIARNIAKSFQPEEIILFGSHAYGKPSAWSDVDLLVVMDAPKGELETSLEIMKSFPIRLSMWMWWFVRAR